MSQEELIQGIKTEMDDEIDTPSLRPRNKAVFNAANKRLATNIGKPVYEYLDTVYWERVQKYMDEFIKPYDDRIKSLEAKVK